MSGLQVNEPGMLALVQDFGRFGWLAQGIVAVGRSTSTLSCGPINCLAITLTPPKLKLR